MVVFAAVIEFQSFNPLSFVAIPPVLYPWTINQHHIRWKEVLTTKHYQGLSVILIQTHSDTSHFDTSLFSQGVNSADYT